MPSRGQRIDSLERRSLFGLILLFSFGMIFGVACIVGYNFFTKATDAAIRSNGIRTTLFAKLILEHQRAAIGVLRSYGSRPLLVDSVKRKDFEGALRHLTDLAKNNPEVEWPFIANPDSTIWVNFPVDKRSFNKDLSGRDWYKGVSGEWKPYISSLYKMVAGEKDLAVTVSVPVFDEKGKVIGILNATQTAALFRKIIDEVSSNSDVYMTLIDQEGHIIYSNRFPYTKEAIDYPSFDFVRRAMKGEKGNIEIQDSSDGNKNKYVSFAPIEGIGWSIIVEKGKSEVFRSEYSNFALIAVISFLMYAVVALSLVYFRARQRQIRSLEKVNEELDGRVRERTAELEITNQNLKVEITERKKAEEALRESEQRWATTLGSIGDAVIATDVVGNLTFMNAVAEELTGWTLSDAVTKPVTSVFNIVNEKTRQKVENPVIKVLEGGNIVGLANHTLLVRKDGTEVPIDDSGAPIRDLKGKTTGVVLIFRDITERKRVEEKLHQQTIELQQLNEALEQRVQERTEDLAKSHQRLQQLASQLLQAQEKERKRVAVELHDSLLSELAAMKYLFEAKLMLFKKGQLADTNEFDKVTDIMQKVMKDARGIMNNLRPSILDEMGLIPTIGWFSQEYQKAYGHIQIRTQLEALEKDIPDVLKVVIFRVLQEALNNFARHGRGNLVELSLLKSGDTLHLKIQDNGQGFDVGKVQKGLGLGSMQERVEFSGGEFQIESGIGQGTTIRAIWNNS